jgi:hypothetical protein
MLRFFFAPRRREKMSINYYLAPGTRENWKAAISNGNVWGLPINRRQWRTLKKGDVVFFYVMAPIKGVVGYGSIVERFRSEDPIFAEERVGTKKWPLRFNFEILWPSSGSPFSGPSVSVRGLVEGSPLKKFHRLKSRQWEGLLNRCQAALK